MRCKHAEVTRGSAFDHCEDCGAVRSSDQPGRPPDKWHSCIKCRREPIARGAPPKRSTRRPKPSLPVRFGTHKQKVVYANELWRRIIYSKAVDGRCARCGTKPEKLQAMHVYAKGAHPRLRFDLDNGAPGCYPCHLRIDSDHAAKNAFALRYLGEAGCARLALMAAARGKTDMDLTIMNLERECDARGILYGRKTRVALEPPDRGTL